MVFYFTTKDPKYIIFMGKDKYENEELIRYGWPEDIWFHVDNLSSAHVYLRLPRGETIDDIPEDVLEDCVQLVKANSIQGNKQNNIDVVYTPWSNLKKTQGMEVGQVGYYDDKKVKTVRVAKRVNLIINRLNKTKVEKYPDLAAEKEARLREDRVEERARKKQREKEEKEERERKQRERDLRNYTSIMSSENMTSNVNLSADYEDEFM
jgi:hypothetical protein